MTENQKRRFEDRIQAKPLDWDDAQAEKSASTVSTGSQASSVLTDERIVQAWQSMPGGPSGWLKEFGYLQFARAIEAEVLAQAGVRAEPGRTELYWAAINCAHSITDDTVILRRNPTQEGNALSQLADRLAASVSATPTTPAQVPAAEVRAQALKDAMQACEDLLKPGAAFFPTVQGCRAAISELAQSSTADKASEVRAALEQEVAQLKQRLEKSHKALFITSQALHNQIVGNQSAWIEWQHGEGAESAMTWIHNGLAGPGLIPDGKEAQPWFDANQDDRYDIPPMKEVGAAPSTADSGNTDEKGGAA